jgi:hypothetical protein
MARRTSEAVVEVDELTIDGRNVRVRHTDLPLDRVRLDPRNPRIANTFHFGSQGGGDLDSEIELLLWKDDDVKALYRQILVNRGLVERIIVREDRSVVEGNCRTVCYRRLRAAFPNDAAWKTIPARILPPDIGVRDVAILLGEMHVAGKNTWTPFEKAGHVYQMHKDLALTQDEIAQRLRMSKSKVNQLIRAFDVMKNKFLIRYPGFGSVRKFSYFEELFRKPELRDWVSRNPRAEDQFVAWVGDGRIDAGTQVRDLPKILENPQAAQEIVGEDSPEIASKFFQKMLEMTEALRTAQVDDIQRVRNQASAKRIVRGLNESLAHFSELAGLKRG